MTAHIVGGEKTMRYSIVAIILHWVIAMGILTLIGLGLIMDHVSLDPMRMFQLFQLHKSIGIVVMLLVVMRIGWRFTHTPPVLPKEMSLSERKMSHWAHRALYCLQIALPLSGWAMVSVSVLGIPTVLFGVVPWPDMPILATLQNKASIENVLKGFHQWMAWGLTALIMLHLAAVVRHRFVLRDSIWSRMQPWPLKKTKINELEEV